MAGIVGIKISEASMKPARSFSPALIDGNLSFNWIYWIAPRIGSVIAVFVFKLIKNTEAEEARILDQSLRNRSLRTLNAIKSRVWKEKWPLMTEVELKATGPWVLKPYQYHNQTFWPWTTGIEMLARSRFDQYVEGNILLSKLASEDHPHIHTFYEWINPITDNPDGAFPFRTGISGVRIAIAHILQKIKKESSASINTKR